MRMQGLLVSLLMAGIGCWTIPAFAQAGGVQVSVPFRFRVGGKTFAAGEYTMVAGSHQVRVVSQGDNRTLAIAIANDFAGHSAGANGRVMFRCYGEHCFLAEVWSPVADNGRQLVTSREEAESGRERRGTYFAILGEPRR